MEFAVASFFALLAIFDPFSNIPIFTGYLEPVPAEKRAAVVRKAHVIAIAVMVTFAIAGQAILELFELEVFALRIAGGILLFVIAMEMLFGKKAESDAARIGKEDAQKQWDALAASPLAVPLLTGPVEIVAVILLFQSAPTLVDQGLLLAVIALVFATSYLMLSRAEVAMRRLGTTGSAVVVRVMGVLLSALAVQFVIEGLREAFAAGVVPGA